MNERDAQWSGWSWTTLMLSSVSLVAIVFSAWELVENQLFRHVDYVTLHYLYITRGIASSLLLALWAAWYVLRQRRKSEEEIRLSREHYRRLLEASPGAVALYDPSLVVTEWNRTAELLYGFSKADVIGRRLPTVPPEREPELAEVLRRVQAGEPIAVVETVRRDAKGAQIEVQLSLLLFQEGSTQDRFLEVTEDIRERTRLRQTLIEIEKLTSMGRTAAGTAHHLNTPLATMLLRVQMMRERRHEEATAADLERLEGSLLFCQQFVSRLLDFTRRPEARKQPEDLGLTLESVMGFLAPSVTAHGARVAMDVRPVAGTKVLADKNLLEVLFTIVLGNALDAVPDGGRIEIRCARHGAETIVVEIADNGSGIAVADLPHLFEPFFTTKGPGKGTGLGLAIARSVVLEHGGTIGLQNASAGGAVASITLPIWQPGAAEAT
ncbi:MAG TPA: ATP-binding protein [Thermoanaerobaculia bacterium]|jgi:PAS domain S-box-containing protein